MVGYEGEKMSKSKGNLVLVSRLREAGVDPMAIRLALLAHHYRSDWEWTDADLTAAHERLAAWRAAVAGASPAGRVAGAVVRDALADDLDAPARWPPWTPGPPASAVTARVPPWSRPDARLGIVL